MKKTILIFICFHVLFLSCTITKGPGLKVNFNELDTKTNVSIRGLYVIDENIVWASGSEGTVLLTNNGGESWKKIKIVGAGENDFRSIHAWDKNRAMVFGISGPDFGYFTKDGGANWEVVFKDTTKGLFFNSLKFANETTGLAISDPVDEKFFVIRTEDRGKSWERVLDMPDVMDGESNFAASNTCIEFLPSGKAWIATGGKAARVFYSEDFGKSWDVSRTPMIRGQSSSGIFSVSFKNDREGVLVGGIYDHPEINNNIAAYTFDGGKIWHTSEVMPKEYRSCVQHVAGKNVNFFLSNGKTGFDYSTDGGKTWNFLAEEGYYTFRPISNRNSGFVAGSEGRIALITF